MEMKTPLVTLVNLYNDQLALVLNRKAMLRMLQKMDPKKVVTVKVDPSTLEAVTVTVAQKIAQISETVETETALITEYELMIKEITAQQSS